MNDPSRTNPAAHKRNWHIKLLFNGILLAVVFFVVYQVMKNVSSVSVAGVVTGTQLEVAAKQSGTLSSLEVGLNQSIQNQQVVARMTSKTLDAKIAAASAELEQLQYTREQARSDVQRALKLFTLNEKMTELEGDLMKLKVDITSATATIHTTSDMLAILNQGVRRAQNLFDASAITRSQLEDRQLRVQEMLHTQAAQIGAWRRLLTERKTLEGSLKLYRQQAENLKQEQDHFLTDIDMSIRRVRSDLQTLAVEHDSMILTAEASGVVSEVLKNAGELVSSGEPILRVVTGDRKWVEAYVPPEQRLSIQPHDSVEVVLDNSGKCRISGKVRDILPVMKEIPFGGSAFLGVPSQGYTVVIVDFDDTRKAHQMAQVGQRVKVVFLPKQKNAI